VGTKGVQKTYNPLNAPEEVNIRISLYIDSSLSKLANSPFSNSPCNRSVNTIFAVTITPGSLVRELTRLATWPT
jgi:hypothetical protein